MPPFLDFDTSLENSRLDQTTNTPALATLFLLADQIEWMNSQGGLEWSASRCDQSAGILYSWAENARASPPPLSPTPTHAARSSARSTSSTASTPTAIAATLRANGIVDTESYRKLGRNQLRIAMFPAIEPTDVEALSACVDWIVEQTG